MKLQTEGGGEPLDGGKPDLFFSPGFDLLEELFREIRHLRKFLLGQAMLQP